MASGGSRDKRRVGLIVRRLIGPEDLTPQELNKRVRDLAERVGVDRTTIGRMIDGSHLPKWPNFVAVLVGLRATPAQIEDAEVVYKMASRSVAAIEHADQMDPTYRKLRENERVARGSLTFNTALVPGLLQPKVYAEALAIKQEGLVDAGWKTTAGEERERRQALLYRSDARRLTLHAVVHEAVLLDGFGGPEVMNETYERLIAASDEDNITVQILPFSLDAARIPVVGNFTIQVFDDDPELPEHEAYYESTLGLHEVQGDAPVKTLLAVWHSVAEDALTPKESVAYIRDIQNRVRTK